MPTASYQQSNDYNLVKDIRPFNLPYESVMQEIAQKTEFFKIGVKKVQDAFQTAAGLEPQYKEGQEYLKGFLTQAQKNLEKISKSDLSVMDNAQQATKVFAPLFDTNNSFNKFLLTDSQTKQYYDKQNSLSEKARTSNNGKNWNPDNEVIFRDAQQKYMNNAKKGNYSMVEQDYQNKVGFTPYYDSRKEIQDIVDGCKGISTNTQSVVNGTDYLNETQSKGCNPQRLQLAFQTGLSGAAKQQMAIHGYAIYRGDPKSLVDKYTDIKVNGPKAELDNLQSQLAGLKAGKITDEEKTKIARLEETITLKKPLYEKSKLKYEEMTKGNVEEYVNNNFTELAGDLHFQELTSQLGEAYRTDEYKNIIKPNAVAMKHTEYLRNIALSQIEFGQDKEMAIINQKNDLEKIQAKGIVDLETARQKGELTNSATSKDITPLRPAVFDPKDPPKTTSEDFIKDDLKPAEAKATGTWETLRTYIQKKYKGSLPLNEMNSANLLSFVNNHNEKLKENQDPILNRLYGEFEDAQSTLKTKILTIEDIDAEVKDKRPDLFDDKKLNITQEAGGELFVYPTDKEKLKPNTGTIVVNSPKISELEIKKLLSGEVINGYSVKRENSASGNTKPVLFLNGRKVQENKGSFGPFPVVKLFNSVVEKNDKQVQEVNDLKNKLYTDNTYSNGNYIAPTLKIKKGDVTDEKIKGMFDLKAGSGEPLGYRVVAQTGTGEGTYIQLLDEEGKAITNTDNNKAITSRLQVYRADNIPEKIPGLGNTFKVYDISTRINGLPSDIELRKYNETVSNVTRATNKFMRSEEFKNSKWVESSELPGGLGIVTSKTANGRPVNIIIRKENDNIIYIGQVKNKQGFEPIEANSIQELITILNQR